MNKKDLINKVKALFYAIISDLNQTDKEKRDYYLIIPDFSIPDQINSKRIKKQEYGSYIFLDINLLEKFSEYHEFIEFLENNCELNHEIVEKLIVELFNQILHFCREKKCENEIERYIDLFYNDITKNPVSFHVKEYLIGISLEDDMYEINKDLILRKADSFDFKYRDMGEYYNELRNYSFQFPPVILKYKYQSDRNIENYYYTRHDRPPELLKELIFIDWALLLFKSAPVLRIKTKTKVKSLFERGKTISGGYNPIRTAEKYNISKDNLNDLKKIIKLFKKPEIRQIFEVSSVKQNHINIALNRYQNAYIFTENIPQKITSLISCLEALLSEGAQELKRRLCQRVAIVLKTIGFNPITIYEDIDLAYRIRSKYSHGTTINMKNLTENPNNFIKNLFEYTRLCFLISMQIFSVKTKNEYLKLIDISLLDEKSYSELVKLINEKCIIFNE